MGTWEEKGVGCEDCHGPGSEHVKAAKAKESTKIIKSKIVVNTTAEACGRCHTRGSDDTRAIAKGGFMRHHEQYPEFYMSPMGPKGAGLTCTSCHDAMKGTHAGQTNPTEGAGIETKCTSCHTDSKEEYAGSIMQKAGVTCIDCHMPYATKSAVATGKYVGDVRTHLFRINTSQDAEMFTADGKYSSGYLTPEYVCLRCHTDENKAWARANSKKDPMTLGKTEAEAATATPGATTAAPEKTPKSPGFGLFFAIAAMFAAIVLRRR